MRAVLRYLRRNPSLVLGVALLTAIALFVVVGSLVVDLEDARPLSAPTLQPPSQDYPFGTDRQGRDLLAVMVVGTPLTLRIGFIAGFIGVGLGAVLGFVAAYYQGIADTVIRGIADIGLTVPGLLVLILIAVSIKGTLTVNQMAIVVASLAWLYPTRTIRAQVLSLRERAWVEAARVTGCSTARIMFVHVLPQVLPLAALYGSVAIGWAILAEAAASFLGFGDPDSISWGVMLQDAYANQALGRGAWNWFTPPGLAIVLMVLAGFLLSRGSEKLLFPKLAEP